MNNTDNTCYHSTHHQHHDCEGRDDDEDDTHMSDSYREFHNRYALCTDQLHAMLETEHSYTFKPILCLSRKRPPELGEWRRKICQWEFRVVDHFRL